MIETSTALGHRKVGQVTIGELDTFATRKLGEGFRPFHDQPHAGTLRSEPSTAVGQDRLVRDVARHSGGVAAVPPPVDRFTDHELHLLVTYSGDEHYEPVMVLLARTGRRIARHSAALM